MSSDRQRHIGVIAEKGHFMRCGEIWLASDGEGAVARQRPVVVIESDDNSKTVAVCPLTTTQREDPGVIALLPDHENGLSAASQVRIDRRTILSKTALLHRVGVFVDADLARLEAALSQHQGCFRNAVPNGRE